MERKCLKCGFVGEMDTWFKSVWLPCIIVCFLFALYVVPGIIFLAWAYGKSYCPACGAIGKSAKIEHKHKTEENYYAQTRYPEWYIHKID